ncbi:MAG: oxidative damage protection protein [Acidobacteriota bacterium]|nr:oxidative damage protection protein [Acidobacteriota bacterium]
MAEHMVKCIKLGKEMPGLDEPPFDGELGQKIYENVSQEAWRLWGEHAKMVINEYRLNPADKKAQEIIVQHMEQFFFGEGAQLPPDYVPPQQKQ